MKLIKFLFLFLLITSCSKEEDFLEEVIIPPVVELEFKSKSETYSDINETTGYIIRQKNTDKFFTKDEIFSSLTQTIGGEKYYPNLKSSIQYDFFNDGNVDYLAFHSASWESKMGIYVLIEDINNEPKEPIIFPSTLFSANSGLIADTDGDGIIEMILFSENSHNNCESGGINNYLENIMRIKISPDRVLLEEQIGNIPLGTHDGTSGDIDNDGDVDLIAWPTGTNMCNTTPNIKLPIKLINDGFGNFIEQPFFSDEQTILDEGIEVWQLTSYKLFDIDGDGNLDLIGGHFVGTIDPFFNIPEYNNKRKDLLSPNILISYGDGGNFYYETTEYINDTLFADETQLLYGMTFSDYDKDGDSDLISVTYAKNTDRFSRFDNDNYIFQLYENRGNRNFENVTEQKIEGYSDFTETVFSNFYSPIMNDIDGDGDYDIVATDYHYHSSTINLNLLYWENIGNSFVRREIYN